MTKLIVSVSIPEAMLLSRLFFNKQKLQKISDVEDDENGGKNISSEPIYDSWLVEHPSALSSFDQMMKPAKGKKLVVFLDYDGTLSPIVDDPNRAFMSDEMRAAVREVAKSFPTAIISGRSIDKVKGFVQLSGVCYAGSHGMDIMVPPTRSSKPSDNTFSDQDGNGVMFQPAKKFLSTIQEIYRHLVETTMKIEGAMVENNRFCVSVHFRQVKEEDYRKLEEKVKEVVEKYPEFRLSRGRKVVEIRPSIEWDKGHALEYFLHTLGLDNSTDVVPLYIGDDRTDEDAFKVIRRRGKGYPIIVSSKAKETRALFSLKEPSEVLTFLLRLARWSKSSSSTRSSLSQIWGIGN